MPERAIHLRRPVVLNPQEGVFVPRGERGLLDVIERRWAALCAANPAYFDGRIYHVLGVHRNGHGGASVHVVECAYRFHAVQIGWRDLGARPLGVKGIVRRRDGRILLARRAQSVNAYQGQWEFAPGGVVEAGMQPEQTIDCELSEETGLIVAEKRATAVLFDDVLLCWEIVFEISPAGEEVSLQPREYDAFEWRDAHDLPEPLTPIATKMTPLLARHTDRDS